MWQASVYVLHGMNYSVYIYVCVLCPRREETRAEDLSSMAIDEGWKRKKNIKFLWQYSVLHFAMDNFSLITD